MLRKSELLVIPGCKELMVRRNRSKANATIPPEIKGK